MQTRGTSAINCLFTVSCKIDKICDDVSSIESVWTLLSKFQYFVTTFLSRVNVIECPARTS